MQSLLVSLFQHMRERQLQHGNTAMIVWDTHTKGLAVSSSSSRAKPDLLLCKEESAAANVVTVLEAKPNL